MPRFVLLRHDYPLLHWDFLLETTPGAPCPTWRFAAIPLVDVPVLAERLPDHRAHYLDYEGPVSGNRGHVWRERTGHYLVLVWQQDYLEIEWLEASGRWILQLRRDVTFPEGSGEKWTAHLRDAVTRPSEVSP